MSRGMKRVPLAAALKAAQRFLRTVRCGTLRQVITDGSYEGPDRILSTIADLASGPKLAEPKRLTVGAKLPA